MTDENQTEQLTDDEQLADLIDSELEAEEQAEQEEAKEQVEAEVKSKIDEAMTIAVTSVEMVAAAAESKWDCLTFQPETKLEVSQKAAAVLAKYNCQLPPWLLAYKEELELGLCLGGVIVGAYMTVQKHKELEAANDEKSDQLTDEVA